MSFMFSLKRELILQLINKIEIFYIYKENEKSSLMTDNKYKGSNQHLNIISKVNQPLFFMFGRVFISCMAILPIFFFFPSERF